MMGKKNPAVFKGKIFETNGLYISVSILLIDDCMLYLLLPVSAMSLP